MIRYLERAPTVTTGGIYGCAPAPARKLLQPLLFLRVRVVA